MVPCSDINDNFETPPDTMWGLCWGDGPAMDCWGSSVSWANTKAAPLLFSRRGHLSSFCALLRRFKTFGWYLILLHLQEAWLMGYIALMIDEDTDRFAPRAAGGLWVATVSPGCVEPSSVP